MNIPSRLRVHAAALIGAALVLIAPARAQNLTIADVDRVVGQAIAEAAAQGVGAGAIAVVDRVGNVLGVYVVAQGSTPTMRLDSGKGLRLGTGLEQVELPATFGAISKAITGAYLSSSGNAFTTRTASQIVQENFNPGEGGQPGGPLFGVQFSQLPCSDLMRFGEQLGAGPRRAPLGLAADPGGFPLYKDGRVVGGVGVVFDGVYGLDRRIDDYDRNLDELIAVAAMQGYTPPADIAGRISVEGKLLRYSDVDARHLRTRGMVAALDAGRYVSVPGYVPAGRRDGLTFGTTASGVRPDGRNTYATLDLHVLDDGRGNNRYLPRSAVSPDTGGLSATEVQAIMTEALAVATRARAQIRRPLGSPAEVTVSIVDLDANILAIARTPDAPIFGTDVSLQKARSALFLSRPSAAAELRALPATTIIPGVLTLPSPGTYVDAMRAFVSPSALSDGVAYAERSIGNLARPYYPDGINSAGHGPLSLPFSQWSPFNTGLQLDLVLPDIVARLDGSAPPPQGCTALPRAAGLGTGPTRLANGLQIFPGGVPIYRGDRLIGAIGTSGDGIDQDDMIAFLGVANAAARLNTGVNNAPASRRADQFQVQGVHVRYVNCPFTPFNNSREQNVCAGK
jgi:uncharacterized protein GlcG (DUF336 family)